MPIYEYACNKCGHTFDVLQKMSDAPLTDCPDCGEAALKKLLSAPNFRLKGSGWYETDFKKERKRNLAGEAEDKPAGKADGEAKSGGDGKDKADAAPAKKTGSASAGETGATKPAATGPD